MERIKSTRLFSLISPSHFPDPSGIIHKKKYEKNKIKMTMITMMMMIIIVVVGSKTVPNVKTV